MRIYPANKQTPLWSFCLNGARSIGSIGLSRPTLCLAKRRCSRKGCPSKHRCAHRMQYA
ncbi:hypothetical protein RSAG8_13755, partial [Rhizoctonia solani AG-8 WAC10335]